MTHVPNELGPCIRRADITDCSDIVDLINMASSVEPSGPMTAPYAEPDAARRTAGHGGHNGEGSYNGRSLQIGQPASLADIRRLHEQGYFLVLDRKGGGLAAAVYVEMRSRRGRCNLLSVAPECQGHDLPRRLIAVAEALCQAEGCTAMDLEVSCGNSERCVSVTKALA